MPQLDLYSYTSEVIWLVLAFVVVYFIILKLGLPRLYRVLVYRQKKVLKIGNDFSDSEKETIVLTKISLGVLEGMLSHFKGLKEGFRKILVKSIEEESSKGPNLKVISKLSEVGSILSICKLKENSEVRVLLEKEELDEKINV